MPENPNAFAPVRMTGPDHEPLPFARPIANPSPTLGRQRGKRSIFPGLAATLITMSIVAVAAMAMIDSRQEIGEGRSVHINAGR